MLKSEFRLIAALMLVLMLALAACSAQPGPAANTDVPQTGTTPEAVLPETEAPEQTPEATETIVELEGTRWLLAALGEPGAESPVVEGSEVTLEFRSDGQAVGSGGCNSYSSLFQVDGNTIRFEPVISTMMACAQAEVMDQEALFYQALEAASEFELDGDRLAIWYNNGQGVLRFERAGGEVDETPAAELLCSGVVDAAEQSWDVCRSERFGFEVQYPQDAELREQTETTARIDLPFTAGTNLTEKYLDISVVENAESCTSPLAEGHDPATVPTEMVVIGDYTFTRQTGQGAAAGNRYDWTAYLIEQDERCVSMDFVLHSFTPELQATPPPEYDQEAESEIFEEIVATFRWLSDPTTPTETPAAQNTPTVAAVTPQAERINFASGAASAAVSGELPASGSDLYVLRALAGQTMTVELSFDEGRAILAVWGADGTVLMSDHAEASRFSGQLPSTQDYYIHVKGRPDGETKYRMTVSIPPLQGGESTPAPERITFRTGATSAEVSGRLRASGSDLYVIRALKGQTMTVELGFSVGKAILAVWGADGTVLLSDHAEATRFSGVLPSTQDYYILLKGRPDGETRYDLVVSIPPLSGSQPTPVPERISFERGATSAEVTGRLGASESDLYVIRALEGQTMTVELGFAEGKAILSIWGADGTVLISDHAEATRFSGELPATQDYYIHVRGRPEGPTRYDLVVSIPPL
jgi:heat shock protein HslJ